MSIESKGYVATPEDIGNLVRHSASALQTLASTHGTYFGALLGTAQAELGDAKADKDMQLKALRAVHERFYEVVLKAVTTPDIAKANRAAPAEKKRRALERNRRSNFARSAYSTIRRWLTRVQTHDLMTLKPGHTTQVELLEQIPVRAQKRKMTPEKAQKRAHKLVEQLLSVARALAPSQPTEARAVLDASMNQLAQELFSGPVVPTTDAHVASQEHRPLRVGKAMFWPTESQVIRRERLRKAASLRAAA